MICLDDYHALDRTGRKEKGVTALAPEAQNFELMYDQVKAMKEGKPVQKPIYNHVTGLLDPPEEIKAPKVWGPPCEAVQPSGSSEHQPCMISIYCLHDRSHPLRK